MSNTETEHRANRRSLLKGLAVAGTAVTAAAAGAAGIAQPDETPSAPTGTAQAKGYRLTPHVEEYYRKARF